MEVVAHQSLVENDMDLAHNTTLSIHTFFECSFTKDNRERWPCLTCMYLSRVAASAKRREPLLYLRSYRFTFTRKNDTEVRSLRLTSVWTLAMTKYKPLSFS